MEDILMNPELNENALCKTLMMSSILFFWNKINIRYIKTKCRETYKPT